MSDAPRTTRRDTRIFISAVTRELGSVRKVVKKALEDNDYRALEQDNFPPDYRDLKDKLRRQIDKCDAVVHIAGHCYGAEPRQRPADAPRRSYTQLEYDIAVELKKPVYVFVTGASFPADAHEPEPGELYALQEAHRQRLMATGQDCNRIDSTQELDHKICSLPLEVDLLTDEMQRADEKVDVHGRRLRRWLIAVVVLMSAVLGAVGYLAWQQQRERKEAQTIQQVQQEFAERFLQQLVTNKEITADDARVRALKEVPALMQLRLVEIELLIDRKIAPRATEKSLSALDRARAALAEGNYDGVFQAADDEKQQGRELAMVEGTAALARFRQSPEPAWNARALAAFQRAMALADPSSPTQWHAWTGAAVSAASVLHDLSRYAEAEPLLRKCQRLREAGHGPDSPEVAVVLNNLAGLLETTNRRSEAEPLYRRALAIDEKTYGPDHPEVATCLNNLALLLQATNRLSEAEPLFRRALAIDEKSYGPDHPRVAIDLNNLALLLQATNRLAEAEPLFRRTLAIAEKLYGPDHPDVANRLNNLGGLLHHTNRLWEAEPFFSRAVVIAEKSYGPDHLDVAIDLNNLAVLLQATNRLSEAEPLYRRTLAIAEKSYGPDHPDVAGRVNNVAFLLAATNRQSEAEPLYRRALAIDEKSYGPDHPDVARDLNNLAKLLWATKRVSEAEPLMSRVVCAFARFQRSTGHEHPHFRDALDSYRELLLALKLAEPEIAARIKSAVEGTDKLAPIVPEVDRLLGPAPPVADVLASLDRQYKADGKPAFYFLAPTEPIAAHLDELLRPSGDGLNVQGVLAFQKCAHAEAVVFFEAALELMADQPVQAPARLRARMNRAAALRDVGRISEARDELVSLLPQLEGVQAIDSAVKGLARYHLALCQWRLGDRAAAERSAEASLAAYDQAPQASPVDPSLRRQSEELLAALKADQALPPLTTIDAPAALEAARTRYRGREALTRLPLDQKAAPLLDQVLGPARSTQEVLGALDRQYRAKGKPAVWFLPLDQPIAPHLDELLGKPSR
jgi:tetratricopeptide (TPR) repeat protein